MARTRTTPNGPTKLGDLLAGRGPTDEEVATVAHVLDLAVAWGRGNLPLGEVRRLCTGPDRFAATRFTPAASPVFPVLMRLLDALIATDALGPHGMQYRTPHGVFTDAELAAVEARHERDGDRLRFRFPVAYPWRVRPRRDDAGNLIEDGVPGDPVYAAATFEGRAEQAARRRARDAAPGPKLVRIVGDRD